MKVPVVGLTLALAVGCGPSGSSTPPALTDDSGASSETATEASSVPTEEASPEAAAKPMSTATGTADEGVEDEGGHGVFTRETPDGPLVPAKPAKAQVKGALDADVIRKVVRSRLDEMRACYDEQLSEDPQLAGRIAVQFTIEPEGTVGIAVLAEVNPAEQPGLTAVGECAVTRVREWEFPEPKGGGRVVVTYPFVFAPG